MKSINLFNPGLRLSGLFQVWKNPNPVDLIEEADLPIAVKQVIQRVVKSSRLWRREKLEVANELLAHFEDGLRCGKEAEKLIRDFGDPLVAAQLIRSGKIRNRSMNTKLLYGGLWGFLLFVLTYFGLTAFYHSGKANPSHDYVADLNEPALSVPPGDAAWPIYRPVFAKFGFSEGGDGKFEEIYVKSGELTELATPQDGEAWTTAIKKLGDSAELLDAFRAARSKSHFGLPLYADTNHYSDEDFAALFPKRKRTEQVHLDFSGVASPEAKEIIDQSMIGILIPHVQAFRKAGRILIVDSRWAVEQGDFERVTQNIESIFGFSRQLGNDSFLVNDLVSFAIQSNGFDLIDELLPKHLDQFSEEQLTRIQSAISDSNPFEMIDLAGERYAALDVIQRSYTEDDNGDGRITSNGYEMIRNYGQMFTQQSKELGLTNRIADTWQSFTAPFVLMQFPSRKQAEQEYLELLETRERQLKQPHYAADPAKFSDASVTESNLFVQSLFPAMQQISTAMFRARGQQEATATAIAIYRYQKQNGKLPNSLNDLKGSLLEELPIDQFNGEHLRFLKKEDGFILYSIGYDKVDNQGERKLVSADSSNESMPKDRPEPTNQFSMFGEDKGFDWVLWPRMSKNEN